jgi:bifunctional DNA-binding transcriptional regulator/antitoxin component of YhaV-PrlF toxin-antitoxin module
MKDRYFSLMEINGSFNLTIPIEWVRKMGLKGKDTIKVHVDEENPHRLILSLPDYE